MEPNSRSNLFDQIQMIEANARAMADQETATARREHEQKSSSSSTSDGEQEQDTSSSSSHISSSPDITSRQRPILKQTSASKLEPVTQHPSSQRSVMQMLRRVQLTNVTPASGDHRQSTASTQNYVDFK